MMAVHEEPSGGERGRAVADRVPIFSLFGAEVISSLGNNITHPGGAFVLVTTGRPGQDRPDRCGDGIGSALAAVLGGPLVDRLGFAAGCPDRGDYRHQRR